MRTKALVVPLLLTVQGTWTVFGQLTDAIKWIDPWNYHQQGVLPAEDWMAPGYDDSDWPAGNGVLGFPQNENLVIGGAGVNTVLSQTNAAGSNIITYYFRTTFLLPTTNGVTLMASNLLDDGAVIYLNGREVARPGMPAGVVSHSTQAERSGDISFTSHGVDFYPIPIDFANVGTNVVAVEVHQFGTNSSDMIMGMRLVADIPNPPAILAHPKDVTADAGQPAQFSIVASGTAPLTYRWHTNGIRAVGNTATFTILMTTLNMDGTVCYVTVSNRFGLATSSNAVLTVVPDVNGPKMISAVQTLSNAVEIRFNESITQGSGRSISNYVVHLLGTTNTLVVTQTVWGVNMVRVRTSDALEANTNYVVCIYNIEDQRGNITSGDCIGISTPILTNDAVLFGQEWRFNDNIFDNTLANTNWTDVSFDDSDEAGWTTGAGLFWQYLNPPACSTRATLVQKQGTHYYRRRFTVPSTPATNVTLTIQHVVDDAAVIYVNGSEVGRFNLGSGPVDYHTIPIETLGTQAVCRTLVTNVSRSLLHAGTNNVIAVEVHQAETSMGDYNDMAFDAALSISYRETPVIPVLTISQTRTSATTNVIVGWIGTGWQLQHSTAPEGAPWENLTATMVQGTNRFTTTLSERRFYRLKSP